MNQEITAEAYENAEDAGKIGIWLFLLSEILLFGAFFSSYFMMRWGSADCRLGAPAWPAPDAGATLLLAALNTAVLITSSYTMVRAHIACKNRQSLDISKFMLLTLLLGLTFLCIKAVEYSLKIHHGYYPGGDFTLANPGYSIFFSFYFAMTGLHGLHVIAGLLWIGLLLVSRQDRTAPSFFKKVEYAGLYWHFVDIVWVFLFPLFYIV